MAAERGERSAFPDERPPLGQLVQQNSELQRELFWADVAEVRENDRDANKHPIRLWQIYVHGPSFWNFGRADLPGLYKDLTSRANEDDKRIALSAIISILQK